MRAILVTAVFALGLSACATPRSIKQLARATGPFIAETRGAAPAVQQQFVRQNAIVEGRIARWNERAQAARASATPQQALWDIDSTAGGAAAADAKTRVLFLQQVRKLDAAVRPLEQPATPAVSAIDPGSTAKIMALLDTIATGKMTTTGSFVSWVEATDESLQKLQEDASKLDDAEGE